MTALSKSEQEYEKQDHKEHNTVAHYNKHRYQEVQLLKDSDKVDNLYQAHHYTAWEENSHCMSNMCQHDIQASRPKEEDHSSNLKIVPEIFKVLAPLVPNLQHLVDQESKLDESAYGLVDIESHVLFSGNIFV